MAIRKFIDKNGKVIIALLLMIFLILSLLVIASPRHKAQLSIYSDDWNDISSFRADLEILDYSVRHTSSSPLFLRELKDPERSVFIICGMEREYNPIEINAISQYLSDGGNVILADDFGYGNSLLQNLNIDSGETGIFGNIRYEIGYRFANEQVVDVLYEHDPNYLTIKTETIPSYKLMMNAPSGLIVHDEDELAFGQNFLEDAEIIAQSSSMSWLDLNANFSRDTGERSGPFPMIVKINLFTNIDIFRFEGGSVNSLVLISDPGIFINEMWHQADNRKYTISMISDLVPDGGEVIFDESVHINENSASEVGNFYYSLLAILFGNIWVVILIEIVLTIVLVYSIIKKGSKFRFHRHKDALDTKMLYMMLRPELDNSDYQWIRWIMLDKVRISYDIPYEIFYSYSPAKMAELIDDAEISEFLFGDASKPMGQGSNFMKVDENIIEKIIAWKPSQQNKG